MIFNSWKMYRSANSSWKRHCVRICRPCM